MRALPPQVQEMWKVLEHQMTHFRQCLSTLPQAGPQYVEDSTSSGSALASAESRDNSVPIATQQIRRKTIHILPLP